MLAAIKLASEKVECETQKAAETHKAAETQKAEDFSAVKKAERALARGKTPEEKAAAQAMLVRRHAICRNVCFLHHF